MKSMCLFANKSNAKTEQCKVVAVTFFSKNKKKLDFNRNPLNRNLNPFVLAASAIMWPHLMQIVTVVVDTTVALIHNCYANKMAVFL